MNSERTEFLGRRTALTGVVASAVWGLTACSSQPEGTCIPAGELTDDRAPELGDGTGQAASGGPTGRQILSRYALAVSSDGGLIAASEWWERKHLGMSQTAGTTLWDAATGTIVQRFDDHRAGAIAWHPGGDMLAVGGDRDIDLVTPEGELLWRLSGHGTAETGTTRIITLAFRGDGDQLASLSTDGTIRLWDVGAAACSPAPVLDVRRLQPESIAYAPDGLRLTVAGPGGPVETWDPESGKRRTRWTAVERDQQGVAYLPDGRLLVGTAPRWLTLVSETEAVRAPDVLAEDPGLIAVAADDLVAVTGRGDNQVVIGDPASARWSEAPRVPGSAAQLAWLPGRERLCAVSPQRGLMVLEGGDWQAFEVP